MIKNSQGLPFQQALKGNHAAGGAGPPQPFVVALARPGEELTYRTVDFQIGSDGTGQYVSGLIEVVSRSTLALTASVRRIAA